MKNITMLNRYGRFVTMKWSYNPLENPKALQRGKEVLTKLNIEGEIYEVAPECFWYRTKDKEINCGLYK